MWNCRLHFLLLTANCQCYCMPADHNLYYIHVEMGFSKGGRFLPVWNAMGVVWVSMPVSFLVILPSPSSLYCHLFRLMAHSADFARKSYSTVTVQLYCQVSVQVIRYFFVTRLFLIAFVQQLGVGRWYTHLAAIYHRHRGICHCALM